MNIIQRIAQLLRIRKPAQPAPASVGTPPREVENDALAYGVTITPAAVQPGDWYWQAVRVHHLTPAENAGRHHLFLDICDPSQGGGGSPYGARVRGARARVSWDGGEQIVLIEKPDSEPGANSPLWRGQVCRVAALGPAGAELPSDLVAGIHSGHPDEANGNTLFHHSFSVTFVKVQALAAPADNGVISGTVRNGAGRQLKLLSGSAEVGAAIVASDETYRFEGLSAGGYRVAVSGTRIISPLVTVDGVGAVDLDLVAPAAGKPFAEYVLFGPPHAPATEACMLLAQDYLLACAPSFGCSVVEAGNAGMVTIIADRSGVSLEDEQRLAAGGVLVERVTGTVEEVAGALAERIRERQALL